MLLTPLILVRVVELGTLRLERPAAVAIFQARAS